MTTRLDIMIESREITTAPSDDAEIISRWTRAQVAFADAKVVPRGESTVVLAYNAALHGATTVLRAAGYRVRTSVPSHHRVTFKALAALAIPNVSSLFDKLEALRRQRHTVVYGWSPEPEDELDEFDPDAVLVVVAEFLNAAGPWLRQSRSSLRERLREQP
jgi:hypothetical protein